MYLHFASDLQKKKFQMFEMCMAVSCNKTTILNRGRRILQLTGFRGHSDDTEEAEGGYSLKAKCEHTND